MEKQTKRTAKQHPLHRIVNTLRSAWLRSLLDNLDRDINRCVRAHTISGTLLAHWLVYANFLRRKLEETTA